MTATTPRAISEKEWTDVRRAGLAAGVQLVREAGSVEDVLISYQKRLMESTALNPVVVCEKSRRTGMTWAAAADAVLTAAAQKAAGGMDVIYIGYNLDMAREFVDTCGMWARSFNDVAVSVDECIFDDGEPESNIQAFRIKFASGFEIMALSSRPRSLRGRQGYVIIDEAAFHDDLDALIKAALALLMWGGKVLIISTHEGDANPFNKLVQDIRGGRKPYKLLSLDFDQALRDGLYQRICLVTGKEWSPEAEAAWRASIIAFYGDGADEELFCIPSQGGGVYLSRALIEARQREELKVVRIARDDAFTFFSPSVREADIKAWCEAELNPLLDALDKDRQHAFGQDFARVSDLSVIAPIEIGKTMKRTVPFVVEMRNIPFEQQRQILFYICDRLPRFIGGKMDANGNGAYLAEVAAQKYGPLRVERVSLTAEWYLENFPPLKTAFEDGAVWIPKDADQLDDLALVQMIRGVPRIPDIRTKGADGKKRHGDFAVALVLAYAQTRANVVEFGYRSASTERDGLSGGPDESSERDWFKPPLGAGLRGSI